MLKVFANAGNPAAERVFAGTQPTNEVGII